MSSERKRSKGSKADRAAQDPSLLVREAQARAAELQAENDRIRAEVQAKNLFLAELSHELRTPLNAVIGFAELLGSEDVPVDPPQQRRFAGHILTSGRRLLQLINDVLELSRIDAGPLEFVPVSVSLERLIAETVAIVDTRIARKRLQLGIQVAAELGEITVDPGRLKQVIVAYLWQAIAACADDARIVIRARPEGAARFRLEVEYGGPAVTESDRMFDALVASERRGDGAYGGPVSMALARRIVEAQGGAVGLRGHAAGPVLYLVLDRSTLGAGRAGGADEQTSTQQRPAGKADMSA